MKIDSKFWKHKRVYLTGHTGFKGSWLAMWLTSMGAIVKGYSLNPPTTPSLFEVCKIANLLDSEIGDICNLDQIKKSMVEFNPDILIHMAAQPLVRLSYKEPVETYSTNVMGTVHVLEAARLCANLKSIVNITTDKCYENKEWEWGYRENEAMGGHDPYSSSKGCAELVASAYRRSFFNSENTANMASARAGNVIGGGDWAEDRLIPDILRAFDKNEPVIVRNPLSTRPWQHVLEPLSGYLVLAQKLYEGHSEFADGWNFGPKEEDAQPVRDILNFMTSTWGEGASWELDRGNHPHEAGYLKLDCSKAKRHLSWTPTWRLENTLDRIIRWHKHWKNQGDMLEYSLIEIKEFMNDINGEKL